MYIFHHNITIIIIQYVYHLFLLAVDIAKVFQAIRARTSYMIISLNSSKITCINSVLFRRLARESKALKNLALRRVIAS